MLEPRYCLLWGFCEDHLKAKNFLHLELTIGEFSVIFYVYILYCNHTAHYNITVMYCYRAHNKRIKVQKRF